MAEFYLGSYDKAYAAFNYLATRLPLTEVYNNLGVVEARRGHLPAAVEYFSKAVEADPNDSDYRFNLSVALYGKGDCDGSQPATEGSVAAASQRWRGQGATRADQPRGAGSAAGNAGYARSGLGFRDSGGADACSHGAHQAQL